MHANSQKSDDPYCFDVNWDFDVTGIEDYINEFCEERLDEAPVAYDFTRADGSDFEAGFDADDIEDPEECKGAFTDLIQTCLDEKSEGDAKYFKGGYWDNGNWIIDLTCVGESCNVGRSPLSPISKKSLVNTTEQNQD